MIRSILVIIAALSLLPCSLRAQQADGVDALTQLQKLNQVYRYLSGMYVEEVEMAPLVESAIKSMLAELDPHSAYIDAEEMKGVRESFVGEFSGIGVEFNLLQDTVMVVNTIVGGPAEKVGVLPNDRIVAIDGENAVGISRSDVPKRLRGETGSTVEITVVRHGVSEPLEFRMVRDRIPINTVDAAYRIDDRIGYIKVNRFGQTTMEEFRKAFGSMKRIDGLILDLRGNGGGLLDQAIEMANFFLPAGSLIVSTEGRAISRNDFRARHEGEFTRGRVVVLIDENSASASEIVSGAIQDWDRGVIVGRPSFGKGLVQRQFPLSDGSAVRVTIARYHTPSGRVIQRPYEQGKRDEYYKAHYRRLAHQDTVAADSAAPLFRTLRTGRPVHGGGGITPDIVVEADTTGVSDYLWKLVRRGVINEYVLSHLDSHRAELTATYRTFDDYDARFEVTQQMLDGLVKLAESRGVEPDAEGLAASAQLLRTQLKAIIAQKLFDMTAYYRIMNRERGEEVERAVELLRDWKHLGAPLLEAGEGAASHGAADKSRTAEQHNTTGKI